MYLWYSVRQEEREKKTVESEKRERPELEAADKPAKEKPAPVAEEPEDAEKYTRTPKVEAEVVDEESKLVIGKAKVGLVTLLIIAPYKYYYLLTYLLTYLLNSVDCSHHNYVITHYYYFLCPRE